MELISRAMSLAGKRHAGQRSNAPAEHAECTDAPPGGAAISADSGTSPTQVSQRPSAASVLLVESLYDGDAPADARLELDFVYRTKSRLRTRLTSGEEVGLFLPRGTVLRGGQKLRARDGRIVEVIAAAEDLREVRCSGPSELARAAYHLGNRHVAVEVGDGWLRIRADHVLEGMLIGLGAAVLPVRAAFEPEAGAYGHGHQHGDDAEGGGSGARIHMMSGG